MIWLHALPNNNAVKLKTTLPRIGQLGTKIYHRTCVFDGWVWTAIKLNVWTRSFWWVYYINTKTSTSLGNGRIKEHAGLTETFGWIVSILYLESRCLDQYDSQAFLFSLVNMQGWAPVKFNQTGKYSSISSYSCYSLGPIFGGKPPVHDLKLDPSYSTSHSDLGYTYSPPSGHSYRDNFAQSFLAGSYQFHPDEIETFYDAAFTSQGRFED